MQLFPSSASSYLICVNVWLTRGAIQGMGHNMQISSFLNIKTIKIRDLIQRVSSPHCNIQKKKTASIGALTSLDFESLLYESDTFAQRNTLLVIIISFFWIKAVQIKIRKIISSREYKMNSLNKTPHQKKCTQWQQKAAKRNCSKSVTLSSESHCTF